MDRQAVADLLNVIIARLEDRITDPRFGGGNQAYALAMEHAVILVHQEADIAELEL